MARLKKQFCQTSFTALSKFFKSIAACMLRLTTRLFITLDVTKPLIPVQVRVKPRLVLGLRS